MNFGSSGSVGAHHTVVFGREGDQVLLSNPSSHNPSRLVLIAGQPIGNFIPGIPGVHIIPSITILQLEV